MAWYTTQVKTICETLTDSHEGESYRNVIPKAIPKVFDFEFPLFDESYKNILCSKILKRYYMREIAHETVGLWKLRLDTVLNEIMPYYNQLYESSLLEFNPFYDVDYERKGNKIGNNNKVGTLRSTGTNTDDNDINRNINNTNTSKETSNNTTNDDNENNVVRNSETDIKSGSNKVSRVESNSTKNADIINKDTVRISDTPQGSLENIENNTYLTKAQINDATNQNEETQNNTGETTDQSNETGNSILNESVSDTGNRTINNSGEINGSNILIGTDKTIASSLKTHENTNNETYTINSLDDYIETIKGKQGTENYSSLLLKFRETFINIDNMILNDLSPLFFGLWDFQGGQINGEI